MPATCCPGKAAVTMILIDGEPVGISGLNEVLAKALERRDDSDDEQMRVLMAELKKRNYVPQAMETKYEAAIWEEYSKVRNGCCACGR